MWNLKGIIQMNLFTKHKVAGVKNKLWLLGVTGKGIKWKIKIDIYTLLYMIDN